MLVKEEAKPMPPPGQLYAANIPRMMAPSAAPRQSLPSEKTDPEKAVPKHVTLPGGSITQGKPVFRTQLTPTNEARDREKERLAAPVSTGRGAVIAGAPSSSHPTAMMESPRKTPDGRELLIPPGFLPTLPASNIVGMRFPPGQVHPRPVKVERSSEPFSASKTFTPEDLRHASAASGSVASPMHIDPHLFMVASMAPGPMHGMPFQSKDSFSPRPLPHMSTPPPPKGVERKPQHSQSPAPDMPSRRPSPMVQQMESQYKDGEYALL